MASHWYIGHYLLECPCRHKNAQNSVITLPNNYIFNNNITYLKASIGIKISKFLEKNGGGEDEAIDYEMDL